MRITYVEGVTPAKWLRSWAEQRPDAPIDAERVDEGVQFDALRGGGADAAFVRLTDGDLARRDDEGALLAGLHAVALYREQPVVVVPRDAAIAAVDAVTLADLDDEERTPVQPTHQGTIELVAAGVGVAILPQSVARLHARRDVVARPVTDAADTPVALVWPVDRDDDEIQAFVAVVRGRTARSSRDATPATDAPQAPKDAKRAAPAARQTRSRSAGSAGSSGRRSAPGAKGRPRRPGKRR